MEITTDGNTLTVCFLDVKVLDDQAVRLATEKLASQLAGKAVVFNCDNLEGFSSGALAGMLTLHSKLAKTRGTLALSNVTDPVRKILKSVGMDKLFGLERQSKKPAGNSAAVQFGTILYRGDKKALASLEGALGDWKAFYSRHAREIGVDLDWLKEIWQDKANPWEILIDVGTLHHWVFEADHAEFYDEIVRGLSALEPAKAVSMPWEELAKTESETEIEVFLAEVSTKLRSQREALVILDKASDSYPLAIIRVDAIKKARRLAEGFEDAEVVVPGEDE